MATFLTGYNNPTTTGASHDQFVNGHRIKASDNSDASDQTIGHLQSAETFNLEVSSRASVISGIQILVEAAWNSSSIGT